MGQFYTRTYRQFEGYETPGPQLLLVKKDEFHSKFTQLEMRHSNEGFTQTKHELVNEIFHSVCSSADPNDMSIKENTKAVYAAVDGIISKAYRPIVDISCPGADEELRLGVRIAIEPIGSIPEGTKITGADEFDYLVAVSVPESHIRVTSMKYQATTKAYDPKSYCKLEFHNGDGRWRILSAVDMSNKFKRIVTDVIGTDRYITQNGPAVSLYYSYTTGKEACSSMIKVDLSLGIQISSTVMSQCLRSAGSELLLPPGYETFHPEDTYHVICTGDYWKLSAAVAERNYIRQLPEADKTLYKALKVHVLN